MLDRVPTGAATFEARSLNVASVLEFVGSMFYFYVLSYLYHKKSVPATGLLLIAMRCFPSVQDPEWLESSNAT